MPSSTRLIALAPLFVFFIFTPATTDTLRDAAATDETNAIDLFRHACKLGDGEACHRLGDAYAKGVGVPQNEPRASALYRQACDADVKAACTALEELCARAPEACSCDRAPGGPPAAVRDYDQPPRAIKITKPKYPKDAFAKKIEGVVDLEILIDARGKVTRTRIVKSVPGLDQAALDTVNQWGFSPALKNGQPVATIARAPVMFQIDRNPGPASRP